MPESLFGRRAQGVDIGAHGRVGAHHMGCGRIQFGPRSLDPFRIPSGEQHFGAARQQGFRYGAAHAVRAAGDHRLPALERGE
ncbi:hypothetical protein Ntsu_47890 [Nocardia sp. IFM 10818]